MGGSQAGKLLPLSQCSFASLLVTYANDVIDTRKKDFAVANFAGPGGIHDGLHNFFNDGVSKHKFQLGFGYEIDRIFLATVKLRVSFLSPVTADFQHGHAFNTDLMQRVFDGVELGCANDSFNLGHHCLSRQKPSVKKLFELDQVMSSAHQSSYAETSK
jgi:hypothetical protein